MSELGRLTLKLANTIIDACFEKGHTLKTRPLAVAVLDAGGHLLALQRDEKGGNLLPKIAIAKASGAVGMGISSRQLGIMAAASPNFVGSVGPLSPGGFIAGAGAVLIVDANNQLLGTVAVAGDLPDNDEACALAGIAAAGMTARP
jgi:uncharacterized protein GlcG (DUF336 family)